jgi:hypothetical protein
MSRNDRKTVKPGPFERQGISVACPVCDADPGERCRGGETHEERRKRAAVFAERRVEGIKARERQAEFARRNRPRRRTPAPVVVKNLAELPELERSRYER